MFAMALWDQREEKLFLARDHLGQKPLYYCLGWRSAVRFRNQGLAGRLVHLATARRAVDERRTFFTLHSRAGDSFSRNREKLPSGHWLVFERGAGRIERYWDLRYSPKHSGSEDEIVTQLHDRLDRAVESHMMSDVPLGAFLSGGIDSSISWPSWPAIVGGRSRLSRSACPKPVSTSFPWVPRGPAIWNGALRGDGASKSDRPPA